MKIKHLILASIAGCALLPTFASANTIKLKTPTPLWETVNPATNGPAAAKYQINASAGSDHLSDSTTIAAFVSNDCSGPPTPISSPVGAYNFVQGAYVQVNASSMYSILQAATGDADAIASIIVMPYYDVNQAVFSGNPALLCSAVSCSGSTCVYSGATIDVNLV